MQLRHHVMFQEGQTAEAAAFYASLSDDGELLSLDDAHGSSMARVRLGGNELVIFDSPVKHDFDMTPAVSLYLECESAEEVDALFSKLADGGTVLMPVDAYPFSARYGWCVDRFGLSWQVALIRPA